jgi:hypothetical protein
MMACALSKRDKTANVNMNVNMNANVNANVNVNMNIAWMDTMQNREGGEGAWILECPAAGIAWHGACMSSRVEEGAWLGLARLGSAHGRVDMDMDMENEPARMCGAVCVVF